MATEPSLTSTQSAAVEGADGEGLARRQDRRPHALLDQHGEHAVVDRGLRQPHRRRRPAEAGVEVGEAPADLGADVALVGERQDQVVVRLGDGAAGGAVALDHAGRHVGVVARRARTAASGPTLNDRWA